MAVGWTSIASKLQVESGRLSLSLARAIQDGYKTKYEIRVAMSIPGRVVQAIADAPRYNGVGAGLETANHDDNEQGKARARYRDGDGVHRPASVAFLLNPVFAA